MAGSGLVVVIVVVLIGGAAAGDFGNRCEASSIHSDCGRELGCVDGACACCAQDVDCQSNRLASRSASGHFHKCKKVSSQLHFGNNTCATECHHKDLFPMNHWDWICMIVVTLCIMVAASAGIGGGGLIVPSFIFLANFPPDLASPLSSVTITGGAIANYIAYCRQQHPDATPKKPLIEYEVSLLIMPALLAGTGIGALLDKVLPLWLITVLLFVLLLALSIRTSLKARASYKAEKKAKKWGTIGSSKIAMTNNEEAPPAPEGADSDQPNVQDPVPPALQLDPAQSVDESGSNPKQKTQFPKKPIFMTIAAWMATAFFALLKGGKGFPSVIPAVQCGNAGYWIFFSLTVIAMAILTFSIRNYVLVSVRTEQSSVPEDSIEPGGNPIVKEVKWDSKNTITFPLICLFCGVCAGMLGIGGGMVVGPILVELGLHPKVVAATSAYAVLVSASAAAFQFLVMGLLLPGYSLVYLTLGFAATLAGQRLTDAIIKKLDLSSVIVIVIAFITVLATVALGYRSVFDLVVTVDRGASMGFRPLCK